MRCIYVFINFVQKAKMWCFRRETGRKRGLWAQHPFQMPKWNIHILETELIEKLCQVVTYFMLTPFSFQSSEHDQQQLQKQIIYFEQSLNRVWWILKDFHLYPFPVVRKQLCYWTIKQAPIAKVRDSHTANNSSIQLSLQREQLLVFPLAQLHQLYLFCPCTTCNLPSSGQQNLPVPASLRRLQACLGH